MNIRYILFACALPLFLSACDDDEVNPTDKGSIVLEFDNRVGDDKLQLNEDFTNGSGETFQVTKLNYYISNVTLTRTDGSEYVVPQEESYFLIREENTDSRKIRIDNVPAGDYNKVTFIVGVDSLRSTMDISKRTGVLDPAQTDAMYWVWNSGYIFFKMEGTSPAVPSEDKRFYYHIGGYGGYDAVMINNIREVSISMGSARAEVRKEKAPQVHIFVDILKVFDGDTTVKIEEHPNVMLSDFSATIANNYVSMFRYDHVHN